MIMAGKKQSIIDQSMTINGEITCAGQVIVKGEINGILSADSLIVEKNGRVQGQVAANEIECAGSIQGNVRSDRFVMKSSGNHLGTVETGELEVAFGATVDCVLQSGVHGIVEAENRMAEVRPPIHQVDLVKLGQIFSDKKKCCAMDVPWSERRKLLGQVVNMVEKGKELIKITGDKGCGKTTFIMKLAGELPRSTKLSVLSDPVGSVKVLLATIAAALGSVPGEGESQDRLVERIRNAAGRSVGEGIKNVLAIDDADTMYPATIEGLIRCLTNISGENEKLLQIILLGTGAVEDKLIDTTRDYFEDETNCLLTFKPLTIEDTADYLRFCLQAESKIDGAACMSLFPYETIKKLHARSRGNIAEINRLVPKSLLLASEIGASTVLPRFL